MKAFLAAGLMGVAMFAALPVQSAVVGTFTAVGESLTTPLAFNAVVFNSFSDVQGGLSFAISPGLQGPVKLELVQSTANVKVAAAAIGGAFGITQALPLVVTSTEAFSGGVHSFAVGAVTAGSKEGAMIMRLTLTPVPGALLLAVSGGVVLGGMGWNFARRRDELPG